MHDWSADVNALLSVEGVIGLITLSVLEIILGIDNIIFISMAVNKLPRVQQKRGRLIGISLALMVRCTLLFFIGWIVSLKAALFYVGPYGVSGKGLILIGGGIFLLVRTWKEIMEKIYTYRSEIELKAGLSTFRAVVIQVIIIDFVFSFDSILAAVGVSGVILIMICAVVISMILMMVFIGAVSEFIEKNQGIKTVALAFLLAIGGVLLAEGLIDCYNLGVPKKEHLHLNKNYFYIALVFALFIEALNMKERRVKRERELELKRER